MTTADTAAPPLDTLHVVETPEGVRLSLRTAGPVPRALAYLVDASIRVALYVALATALFTLLAEAVAAGLMMLFVFAAEWFYPVAFELWRRGQTPGKSALGLRVVSDDGTPVRASASILRNLLLAVDALPGTYAAGLVSMLCDRSFRRLGDLAAATLVVHVERRAAAPARRLDLTPLEPPLPLALEDQRAVIAFVERAPRLSTERAEELAALATPLLAPGEPARERVLRIGAWLLGGAEREERDA